MLRSLERSDSTSNFYCLNAYHRVAPLPAGSQLNMGADEWFNPAAFAAPAAFTYGDAGRNSVYGPGMQTMDIALQRAFRITERLNFQFRGEAFSALNKVNLGTPNRFVNTPQFGTITMAMTPGREIQLSARFSF